jgi:hypothetical protein
VKTQLLLERILEKRGLTASCRLVKLEKGAPTSSVPTNEARSTFALVGAVGDGVGAGLGAGVSTEPVGWPWPDALHRRCPGG